MKKLVNEAIEDIFKPKDDEETKELWARKHGKTFVFRVFSGLDAFEIHLDAYKNSKNTIYLPYVDILAHTELEARELVAKMIGQKLEDQDTNPAYDNYVSDNVEKIGTWS